MKFTYIAEQLTESESWVCEIRLDGQRRAGSYARLREGEKPNQGVWVLPAKTCRELYGMPHLHNDLVAESMDVIMELLDYHSNGTGVTS